MDSVIRAAIAEKKIQFKEGNFLTFGFPNNINTLTSATVFFDILEGYEGGSEILHQVGFAYAKALRKELQIENPEQVLDYFVTFCYGNPRIVTINKEKAEVIFDIPNSPLCRMHAKLFGNKKSSMSFIDGMLAGVASEILNKNLKAEHHSCIINAQSCGVKTLPSDIKEIALAPLKIKDSSFQPTKKATNLIDQIESQELFEWDEGMFSIFKCGAVALPAVVFAKICELFEKKRGAEFSQMLHKLGRIQAKNAVMLQVQEYGFAKDEKLMSTILKHTELMGFGLGTLKHLDFEGGIAEIDVIKNSFAYARKGSSESVDEFLSGLIAGMCEAFFASDIIIEETACVAKGDAQCSFLVKKGNSQCKVPKELVQLLEEKITPANFVL